MKTLETNFGTIKLTVRYIGKMTVYYYNLHIKDFHELICVRSDIYINLTPTHKDGFYANENGFLWCLELEDPIVVPNLNWPKEDEKYFHISQDEIAGYNHEDFYKLVRDMEV